MYNARILADSISPDGVRLTTSELTYPRFVHSEFMTHRMFARNAASSRAIPIKKMIERVVDDPVLPVWWGKNQKGMQAKVELKGEELEAAQKEWLVARDDAVRHVEALMEFKLHKQIANRILEPWMWITVICTATETANFDALRCHKDAQPEIRRIAEMWSELRAANTPKELDYGQWHLPLVRDDEADLWEMGIEAVRKVSVGRCTRVSYLTHDGQRDLEADLVLHDRILSAGHMSPFEHVARPVTDDDEVYTYEAGHYGRVPLSKRWSGNLRGWVQYRKTLPGERVFQG